MSLHADTLWELLERRAGATPRALFAVDERDRRMTFAEYRDAALRTAAGLHALGVREGTPVSWTLPTWLETLVLEAALCRLGALQNPILPIYRKREVAFVTGQTGARLLIVPRAWRGFEFAEMAREIAAAQPGLDVCVVDPERSERLPEGDPASLPDFAAPGPGEEPVRWIFYTSGTTADPKGARHSDRTILSHAGGMAQRLDLREGDRAALVFPFTHIGGSSWLACALSHGCALVCIAAFDPEQSTLLLARHGVTHAGAGTVFHQAYLNEQRRRSAGGDETPLFPHVRCFPGGAAPKPPLLHYELKAELGGVGIVSGYGLTECPIIAMNATTDPDEKLAHTEGRVSPDGAEIRVVRPDGVQAEPGEEGELRVRGPQLCKGYVDASLDAAAFDESGYFRTGDLGFLDGEGFVTITGRLKDVIIRKGENIPAKQVEDLLHLHPRVAEAAVIGLPDPALGERCCAVVATAAGSEPLGFDEMVNFLKDHDLMLQKIPEQLELVGALPRNPSGKVLKNELRERYRDLR